MKILRVAAVVAGLLCPGVSAFGAVFVADPSAVVSGAEVSSAYTGFALSRIEAQGAIVDTTITQPVGQSSSASFPVYSTGQYFAYSSSDVLWTLVSGHALRADLTATAASVSVQFVPDDIDSAILQSYAADGTLLNEIVQRSSSPFSLQFTMTTTPIAYILATYGDTGRIGAITYEQATAVPEPPVGLLTIFGLALIGTARLRQTKARR